MKISYFHRIVAVLGFSLLLFACSGGGDTTRETGRSGASAVKVSKARRLLLNEAHGWLGVPYAYGGTSQNGVDCSGLVYQVYGRFGVKLPRSSREMFGEGRPITRSTMLPGDLVFFANTAARGISHVGIFIGGTDFIHSSTQAGVIKSSLDDTYYKSHFAGARKIIK